MCGTNAEIVANWEMMGTLIELGADPVMLQAVESDRGMHWVIDIGDQAAAVLESWNQVCYLVPLRKEDPALWKKMQRFRRSAAHNKAPGAAQDSKPSAVKESQ